MKNQKDIISNLKAIKDKHKSEVSPFPRLGTNISLFFKDPLIKEYFEEKRKTENDYLTYEDTERAIKELTLDLHISEEYLLWLLS